MLRHQKIKKIFPCFVCLIMPLLLSLRMYADAENALLPQRSDNTTVPQAIMSGNPIQIENSRPGTTNWKLDNPSNKGEIQAYTGADSIDRGGSVNLYISARPSSIGLMPPTVDIEIYRLGFYQGMGGRLMGILRGVQAQNQGYYIVTTPLAGTPTDCPTCLNTLKDGEGQEMHLRDANWKATVGVQFPADWISGIYLFKLTENATHTQWNVPLIVRDDAAKADFVFQDPINTDQAYNGWGGTSLYTDYSRPAVTQGDYTGARAYIVSWNRPLIVDNGAGYLFFWTYSMVRFLEASGMDVTYTTNNAVGDGSTNLANYKAFLSAGHDEYWSQNERYHVEQGIKAGLNVAFFGANDVYWQVRNVPDFEHRNDRFMICYKHKTTIDDTPDPIVTNGPLGVSNKTTRWRDPPVNDAEANLLVSEYVKYGHVGLADFVATNTNNWMYAGTGLHNGNTIKKIVGYEVDILPEGASVPPNATVIGSSPWFTPKEPDIYSLAVIQEFGVYGQPGYHLIFNAATIMWPVGLSDFPTKFDKGRIPVPESLPLQQMTRNLLYRMAHA